MNKYLSLILGFVLVQFSSVIYADNCPDTKPPSPLSYGGLPDSWKPYGEVAVQGEDRMYFVKAWIQNIDISPSNSGVICTYHISTGNFSIKKFGLASPANTEWGKSGSDFLCKIGLSLCEFNIVPLE